MLRLTTSAPPLADSLGKEAGEGSGTEDEGGPLASPTAPNPGESGMLVLDMNLATTPGTAEVPAPAGVAGEREGGGTGRGGLLGGALRPPGFLRALSFSRGHQAPIPMGDVESQTESHAAQARV